MSHGFNLMCASERQILKSQLGMVIKAFKVVVNTSCEHHHEVFLKIMIVTKSGGQITSSWLSLLFCLLISNPA